MSLCEDKRILQWVLNAGSIIVTSHAFGQNLFSLDYVINSQIYYIIPFSPSKYTLSTTTITNMSVLYWKLRMH
jgi:hypothetical protein